MRSGALSGERRQQRIMLGSLSVLGRHVLEEIRGFYSANAEILFSRRISFSHDGLATRLSIFDSDKRHYQRHGKPTGNIAAGTLVDLPQ